MKFRQHFRLQLNYYSDFIYAGIGCANLMPVFFLTVNEEFIMSEK